MNKGFRMQKGSLLLTIVGLLLFSACTKKFEDYNTDPDALSDEQTVDIIASAIGPMEQDLYSNYQTAQNLNADAYAGYMMSPTPFNGGLNNLNYSMVDLWDKNAFNDAYTLIMAPVRKMKKAGVEEKAPEIWAVALLIQIDGIDRTTDRFGPIPYTQTGSSLTTIPYDDQEKIYKTFFKQIDTAVANLQGYIADSAGTSSLKDGDLIYDGNYKKWLKFANSLRLRLAMRVVKADPQLAKTQGEKALSAQGGLLSTPDDDAAFDQSGDRANDIWLVTESYGDNRLNAALATYMTGYDDPRLPKYATPATDPAVKGKYVGIRIGSITGNNNKSDYVDYASLNTATTFNHDAPQLIMTAAEVWFLKAEAALRGWSGAGAVKEDYEMGIKTSFKQWGITNSSVVNDYLSDQSGTPDDYVDPQNSGNDAPALSDITIKWDASASKEEKLERIITQKWLAIFPDGEEAWADYRRTGYPKLFPVVHNESNGAVDTKVQIRRIPYPSTEYNNNGAAVNEAVDQMLDGPDNVGTRLWWDVDKGNFN